MRHPALNADILLDAMFHNRNRALVAMRLEDPAYLNKQVQRTKRILRWDPFFSKTTENLVDLVLFWGSPEFYGRKMISDVVQRVTKALDKTWRCLGERYQFCLVVLSSPLSVRHYFSSSNATRLKIDHVRFGDYLMGWMLDYMLADFTLSESQQRLLEILEPSILKELLRQGTSDLLKVGAFDYPGKREFQIERSVPISPHLLVDVLYLCFVSLSIHIFKCNQSYVLEKGKVILVRCIDVLFRAMPKVSLKLLYSRGRLFHPDLNTKKLLDYVFRWLRQTNALPAFEERLGAEVTSLKHLARCSIRKRVYKNWALPEGLYELGLPKPLANYLNLGVI